MPDARASARIMGHALAVTFLAGRSEPGGRTNAAGGESNTHQPRAVYGPGLNRSNLGSRAISTTALHGKISFL